MKRVDRCGRVQCRSSDYELASGDTIEIQFLVDGAYEDLVVLLLGASDINSLTNSDIVKLCRDYAKEHNLLCKIVLDQEREEFEGVKEDSKTLQQSSPRPSKAGAPGHIYVIKAITADGPAYKIGLTRGHPKTRTKAIMKSLPMQATVFGCLECASVVTVERRLHEKFNSKRTVGEWFRLDDDDLAYLRSQGIAPVTWHPGENQ